jgi:hypothetical protein
LRATTRRGGSPRAGFVCEVQSHEVKFNIRIFNCLDDHRPLP